jgi:hypothetical protein
MSAYAPHTRVFSVKAVTVRVAMACHSLPNLASAAHVSPVMSGASVKVRYSQIERKERKERKERRNLIPVMIKQYSQ